MEDCAGTIFCKSVKQCVVISIGVKGTVHTTWSVLISIGVKGTVHTTCSFLISIGVKGTVHTTWSVLISIGVKGAVHTTWSFLISIGVKGTVHTTWSILISIGVKGNVHTTWSVLISIGVKGNVHTTWSFLISIGVKGNVHTTWSILSFIQWQSMSRAQRYTLNLCLKKNDGDILFLPTKFISYLFYLQTRYKLVISLYGNCFKTILIANLDQTKAYLCVSDTYTMFNYKCNKTLKILKLISSIFI